MNRKSRRCSRGGKCRFGFRKREVTVHIMYYPTPIGKKWICRKCGLWI